MKEILEKLGFAQVCLLENYLHKFHDMKRNRNLFIKIENIINCYEKLKGNDKAKFDTYLEQIIEK